MLGVGYLEGNEPFVGGGCRQVISEKCLVRRASGLHWSGFCLGGWEEETSYNGESLAGEGVEGRAVESGNRRDRLGHGDREGP